MNSRRVVMMAILPAAALLLAGCFGGHAPVVSDTEQKAASALTKGIRSEQKGDYSQAEQYLEQSLMLSSSIEDTDARLTALINLSRLKRLRGEPDKATAYIDRALAETSTQSRFAAEAAYEKALVELARGSAATALPWAEKARTAVNSDAIGSRYNLSARIYQMLGRFDEADELAKRGFRESSSAGQDEEAANALRVQGVVARERQRLDDSLRLLGESLQIDKRIGKSGKISTDLEELARTAEKAGRFKESISYLERAVEVHRAGGRSQQAQVLSARIAEMKKSVREND